MAFVELQLARHLGPGARRRDDLAHHLRRDAALEPLQAGSAATLRPPEGHEHLRRDAGLVVALHRVPEQVAGDGHVGIVAELRRDAAMDLDDVVDLLGVVRHRHSVALGVDELGGGIISGHHLRRRHLGERRRLFKR